MAYPYGNAQDASQIAANASNIKAGVNPSLTVKDFLAFYPQFGNDDNGKAIIPTDIIQLYLDLGQSIVQQARFKSYWKVAICDFIAHYCTLWLRATMSSGDKDAVAQSGNVQGIVTTESVDGVSYSLDTATITQDLEGFASWKTTQFGVNLATLSKLLGKGGMVVL